MMNKLFLIWYCWVIITCVFKLYFYIRIMCPFPIRAILTSYKTSFKVKDSSWCICVQTIASTTECCRLCGKDIYLDKDVSHICNILNAFFKNETPWIMEHGPDRRSQTRIADHRPEWRITDPDHGPETQITDPDHGSQTQIVDHRPRSPTTELWNRLNDYVFYQSTTQLFYWFKTSMLKISGVCFKF